METNTAFKTKIAKVLTELLSREVNPEELNEDTDLIDGIGLNSLDFLQFILKLENEFDIEIDIEKLELHYFKKMGHLKEFITQVQETE
ncbi:phosphopantetheine-binding protein [Sphingobacterium faecium]|uniref:acyl carrier protein n=1 Tax=Sphingobacterium faecium TaxID=34087 RepID=UPI0032098686